MRSQPITSGINSTITEEDIDIEYIPIWLSVSVGLINVLILITNMIVLLASCTQKTVMSRRQTTITVFLCISDISVGISGIVFVIGTTSRSISANEIFCTVQNLLLECSMAFTRINTFLVCLERFLAIKHTRRWNQAFGNRGRVIMIVISWLVIVAYFGSLKTLRLYKKTVCYISEYYGSNYTLVIRMISFFGSPFLIGTMVLYLHTICVLISWHKKTLHSIGPVRNEQNLAIIEQVAKQQQHYANLNNVELEAAKTVGILLLVLCFTSGPFMILLYVEAICPGCYVSRNLRVILGVLSFINSLLNPIVNRCRMKELKVAIRKLVRCKVC